MDPVDLEARRNLEPRTGGRRRGGNPEAKWKAHLKGTQESRHSVNNRISSCGILLRVPLHLQAKTRAPGTRFSCCCCRRGRLDGDAPAPPEAEVPPPLPPSGCPAPAASNSSGGESRRVRNRGNMMEPGRGTTRSETRGRGQGRAVGHGTHGHGSPRLAHLTTSPGVSGKIFSCQNQIINKRLLAPVRELKLLRCHLSFVKQSWNEERRSLSGF